ncbi:helix-turn-helix domain-containing protein [Nocardia sp. NPDC001965]
MSTEQKNHGVGTHVAEERELAGWTQARLAAEAHVSTSLVKAVEQGRAPASPAFISACGRALKVGVTALLEQPYPRTTRDEQLVHAGIPDLRRELAVYRIPPDDVPSRTLDHLTADVARASEMRHMVNSGELGKLLPSLLHDLRVAWHSGNTSVQERIFGLLAETYAARRDLPSVDHGGPHRSGGRFHSVAVATSRSGSGSAGAGSPRS